jgi:sugar lactone lactonase YvrE
MRFLFKFLLLLLGFQAFSQVGPYSWQDHLSFNSANSVAKLGGYIYGSNYNGLIKVHFNERETERKNKINGLSDVGIRLVRANNALGKLMIVYDNSNIDILDQEDKVYNYPDLKLKTLSGKKIVNEVCFKDHFAYLACGFGIVLFDMNKMEVKDTYVIGPGGNNLEVYQVALSDSIIYAATPIGLYKANYKTSILNNFNNWTLAAGLPAGPYCGVINTQGKILAAYSPFKLDQTITTKDTLYKFSNNTWSRWVPFPSPIRKLGYVNGEIFSIFGLFGPQMWNFQTESFLFDISSFNGASVNVKDIVFDFDKTDVRSFWLADEFNGLYQTYGYHPFHKQNLIAINGTNKNYVSNIDVLDGKVAVSPSYPDEGGGTNYMQEGINLMKDGEWRYFVRKDLNNTPILDINRVLFDRKDKTRLWASSWFNGLLEFKDEQLVGVYNSSNTTMGEAYPGASRCSGLSMDEDGNLWMANSDNKKYLSCRRTDGSFVTLTFDASRFTRKVLVDKNNYVWAIHERDQGLTVYKNVNFAPAQLNVNYKILTKDVGNGNLESNSVFSIAEDKDGKIWVGTSAGLRVFYNPTNIFTNANFDAQPIKIVQDGNVELLLDKEIVSAICVDGANNKWVGTQSGGLYCFSPDGLKELYHFTTENSPLYSNTIIDINYDKVTGDVFIGTVLGLQSFRSPIIEGDETYKNVYAFPNPVKPGYNGNVFVRGLVDNSVVKITDESGNLVWETKSQGGQIQWPVKNLSGNRAATGVYVIYAATTTGELKTLTKVLVVN